MKNLIAVSILWLLLVACAPAAPGGKGVNNNEIYLNVGVLSENHKRSEINAVLESSLSNVFDLTGIKITVVMDQPLDPEFIMSRTVRSGLASTEMPELYLSFEDEQNVDFAGETEGSLQSNSETEIDSLAMNGDPSSIDRLIEEFVGSDFHNVRPVWHDYFAAQVRYDIVFSDYLDIEDLSHHSDHYFTYFYSPGRNTLERRALLFYLSSEIQEFDVNNREQISAELTLALLGLIMNISVDDRYVLDRFDIHLIQKSRLLELRKKFLSELENTDGAVCQYWNDAFFSSGWFAPVSMSDDHEFLSYPVYALEKGLWNYRDFLIQKRNFRDFERFCEKSGLF